MMVMTMTMMMTMMMMNDDDDGFVDDGDDDDNDDDDGDGDYIFVMDDAANVEMVSHLHWSLADCWFVVKILCHDLEFEFHFS